MPVKPPPEAPKPARSPAKRLRKLASQAQAVKERLNERWEGLDSPQTKPLGTRYELALLTSLAAFALGHVGVAYSPVTPAWPWLLAFGLLALLGLLLQPLKQKKPARVFSLLWLGLAALLLGASHGQWSLTHWLAQSRWVHYHADESITVSGELIPAKKGALLKVTEGLKPLGFPGETATFQLRLPWSKSPEANERLEAQLKPGHTITLNATMKAPYPQAVPGSFNDWAYRSGQGVLGYLSLKDNRSIETLSESPQSWWGHLLASVDALRANVSQRFQQVLGPDAGALLGGLVLGERAVPLNPALKQHFTSTGLVHLLAASGMNVAMVAGPVLGLLRLCRVPLALSLLITMGFVAFYSLLTGLPPSIQRAATMLELALLLKLVNRRLPSLVLLGLAFNALLLWQPLSIYSLGLQLSVLTTLGILGLTQGFTRPHWPGWSQGAMALLAVPFAAQLWASPLLAQYFHQVPLHSLWLNIAAIALVTPMTNLGFASVLLVMSGLGGLAWPLLKMGEPLAQGLLALADWGARQDWAMLAVAAPSPWTLFWLYAALGWWLTGWHPKVNWQPRTLRLGVLSCLLLAMTLPLWQKLQAQQFAKHLQVWRLSPQSTALVITDEKHAPNVPDVVLLGRMAHWWEAEALSQGLRHLGWQRIHSLTLQGSVPKADVWEALASKLAVERVIVQSQPHKANGLGLATPQQIVWLMPGSTLTLADRVTLASGYPNTPLKQSHRWFPMRLQTDNFVLESATLKQWSGQPSHFVYTWGQGYPPQRYWQPGRLISPPEPLEQTMLKRGVRLSLPRAEGVAWQATPLPASPPFHWLGDEA